MTGAGRPSLLGHAQRGRSVGGSGAIFTRGEARSFHRPPLARTLAGPATPPLHSLCDRRDAAVADDHSAWKDRSAMRAGAKGYDGRRPCVDAFVDARLGTTRHSGCRPLDFRECGRPHIPGRPMKPSPVQHGQPWACGLLRSRLPRSPGSRKNKLAATCAATPPLRTCRPPPQRACRPRPLRESGRGCASPPPRPAPTGRRPFEAPGRDPA